MAGLNWKGKGDVFLEESRRCRREGGRYKSKRKGDVVKKGRRKRGEQRKKGGRKEEKEESRADASNTAVLY